MKIREIVSRLERIENILNKKSTKREHQMIGDLIDTIIAEDLEIEDTPNVSDSKILDAIVKMGIESGQIGQA